MGRHEHEVVVGAVLAGLCAPIRLKTCRAVSGPANIPWQLKAPQRAAARCGGATGSLVTLIRDLYASDASGRWRYFTVASRSDWKSGWGEAIIGMG
ncbi:hypothetical protein [Rhizobium laguerreae]|uniref:hypothetical protein n=1 Tax=Rhizobium laguerreae TaxID=1076926 RepID=UPI001C923C48|nr:hypothetical protein [Rhizobium laguerreae]MBY3120375.1 hypothetical protein [Rhizobium laguerreae]MBY3136984.1 hypothetical protein [Rhizobium laguerreae]MBY3347684.1 hypothetical protein [Rhizobium laguerreae]MBY3354628.1 hypothetical protein [Rhizobium laguerreae]MBY3375692.1 hypothetical protein [Rhizobium laguerreae]